MSGRPRLAMAPMKSVAIFALTIFATGDTTRSTCDSSGSPSARLSSSAATDPTLALASVLVQQAGVMDREDNILEVRQLSIRFGSMHI
jgi:hypothetical protein